MSGTSVTQLLVLIGHLLEMVDEIRDLALTVAPQVHLVRGLHEKQKKHTPSAQTIVVFSVDFSQRKMN